MASVFLVYRWTTFALFIVFSSIICSAAAWNTSTSGMLNVVFPSNTYLIFVSALGLVVIFPVIFTDIARRNFITGRVWFELLWLGVFWFLLLAGAIAATATMPSIACSSDIINRLDTPCTAVKLLLAMSWALVITLASYIGLLFFACYNHQEADPEVWNSSIRDYRWFCDHKCLRNAPAVAPHTSRSHKKIPSFAIPKPKRAGDLPLFIQRGGLSPQLEIEHYAEASRRAPPADRRDSPSPPPHKIYAPSPRAPALISSSRPASNSPASLYPQHLQSNLPTFTAHLPATPPQLVITPRMPRSRTLKNERTETPPRSRPLPSLAMAETQAPSSYVQPPSLARTRPTGPRTPSGDNLNTPDLRPHLLE